MPDNVGLFLRRNPRLAARFLIALHEALQAVSDPFHAPAHNLRSDINDYRSEALGGGNLRDAAPHETDAYDTDFTDPRIHGRTSFATKSRSLATTCYVSLRNHP